MGLVCVLEGTSLSASEWSARLRVSDQVIQYLSQRGILRPSDDDCLELTFVGIVVFSDSLLFAQPKFGATSQLELSEVLRILRHYFARKSSRKASQDRELSPEYGNSEVLREFDALRGLREWFLLHGVYRREKALASDRGRPNWAKTLALRPPLISQESVVYPSVVAERREGTFNDISALQVGILSRLLERYGIAAPSGLDSTAQVTGNVVDHWPISEDRRTYLDRIVALEQRGVYRTDLLNLLKLLREILGSRLAGASMHPQIYGTTAFYSVWEDACRVAVGAVGQVDPIESLGQPVWCVQDEQGNAVRYEHRQIPDVVVVRGSWRLVVDAKYYYRFPISRPGAPDIVKQLYYMDALRAKKESVLSLFLVPLPGAIVPKFLGYATIDGAARRFDAIEAWGLDPTHTFSNYPAESSRGAGDLIDFVLAQRSGIAKIVLQSPTHVCG